MQVKTKKKKVKKQETGGEPAATGEKQPEPPVKPKGPRMAEGAQDGNDEENLWKKSEVGGGKDAILASGKTEQAQKPAQKADTSAKPFDPKAERNKAAFDNAYKQDNPAFVPRGPATRLAVKDTAFAFVGTEVLYLDFEKDTWNTGDVTTFDINQPLDMPDHAGLARVDSSQCAHSDLLVTGGVDRTGAILNWVFGVQFQEEGGNLIASMSLSD